MMNRIVNTGWMSPEDYEKHASTARRLYREAYESRTPELERLAQLLVDCYTQPGPSRTPAPIHVMQAHALLSDPALRAELAYLIGVRTARSLSRSEQ